MKNTTDILYNILLIAQEVHKGGAYSHNQKNTAICGWFERNVAQKMEKQDAINEAYFGFMESAQNTELQCIINGEVETINNAIEFFYNEGQNILSDNVLNILGQMKQELIME